MLETTKLISEDEQNSGISVGRAALTNCITFLFFPLFHRLFSISSPPNCKERKERMLFLSCLETSTSVQWMRRTRQTKTAPRVKSLCCKPLFNAIRKASFSATCQLKKITSITCCVTMRSYFNCCLSFIQIPVWGKVVGGERAQAIWQNWLTFKSFICF